MTMGPEAPGRRRPRPALIVAAALVVLLGAGGVVFALTSSAPSPGSAAVASDALACTSTSHAVILSGNGAVTVGYMPAGFQLESGNPGDIGLGPSGSPLTYSRPSDSEEIVIGPQPAGFQLGSNFTSQFPSTDFVSTRIRIGPHVGVFFTPSPSGPSPISEIDWRVTDETALSVNGTSVPPAELERVARSIIFGRPVDVELPLSPGQIISENRAISAAAASDGGNAARAQAKLTSYAEAETLLVRDTERTTHEIRSTPAPGGGATSEPPADVGSQPWRPVWAVLLSGVPNNLVLVDAKSGQVVLTTSAGPDTSWFSVLTDRAPGAGACDGGSSAAVPFGVLTRAEEEWIKPGAQSPAGGTTTTYYKLVKVAPGSSYYTGYSCTDACPTSSLEWVWMAVTVADHGTRIPCPLPEGPGPRGGGGGAYHPQLTNEYTQFSYGNGGGITCNGPPSWFSADRDYAPPA
jgi:hypothetical protein